MRSVPSEAAGRSIWPPVRARRPWNLPPAVAASWASTSPRGRSRRQGASPSSASFDVAPAENTGLEANAFDLVTAGQCWHWFEGDAVLAEVRRVLRPGGLLAIVDYSYLAEHSPVARDTEKLILEFNPSWEMAGWTGVAPGRIDDVIRGG